MIVYNGYSFEQYLRVNKCQNLVILWYMWMKVVTIV
jgi:hypothetical protein